MYMNSGDRVGVDYDALVPEHLASPSPPISHMDLADVLADPDRSRALVCWNMNIAASAPRQREILAALVPRGPVHARRRPVPDRHRALRRHRAAGGDVPRARRRRGAVLRPRPRRPGARPSTRPARRCATARSSAAWPPRWATTTRRCTSPTRRSWSGWSPAATSSPSLAELRAAGTVYPTGPAFDQFADGVFDTPSGRIEIASAAAEADGHARVPDPHADEPPADGLLRLLSPASPWTMNATFSNDRKVRGRLGAMTVTMHANEAAKRGLVAGDRVRVTSDDGALDGRGRDRRRRARGRGADPEGPLARRTSRAAPT